MKASLEQSSSIAPPIRVLVVDDEPDLRTIIEYNLSKSGFDVTGASDGISALELAKQSPPDILVLDVMMPGLSGIEVAKQLRAHKATASIPIIMLTAKVEEAHELEGLHAGADDYIAKPVTMPILIARINSLTRRTRKAPEASSTLNHGPISIHLDEHQVTVDDTPIQLTITEFRLLTALVQSSGKVLSRTELISKAIGPAVTVTPRTVDVHITSLRKKLGQHSGMITTVRAVGYRIDDPE